MPIMTGGEALLQSLKRNRVDTVFSLVGNQLATFYDAWIEHPEIREIGVRHELGGGYMALGYAWASGKPGVCVTVGGPGALHAAGAMGTAAAGNLPVLLISGQVSTSLLGKDRRVPHQFDAQAEVFARITKGARVVRDPAAISYAVNEAFYVMTSGVPGPYELEFPVDVLDAKADIQILDPLAPPPPSAADREVLEKAAEEIARASHPAILVGFGAILAGASDQVRTLAELLRAPVYTSFKAKGVIPEDHPQCMGATSDSGGITSPIAPETDLVLALGTRMVVWTKGPRALPKGKRVIQFDLDPRRFGVAYPVEISVVGDLRQSLSELLPLLRTRKLPGMDRDWPAMKQERLGAMRRAAPQSVPLLESLRQVLPRNTIVGADVTSLGGWSGLALDVYEPRTYLSTTYFTTLGLGFPVALGAKVAHPNRPVVHISGDGAFLFNSQELETARRYGLAVVTVIIDDSGYGTVRSVLMKQFGRSKGDSFGNPDWVKLAEAYGARCFAVKELDDIPSAVAQALSVEGPSLVVAKHGTLPPYTMSV
ncbi:MAG: thiamine pyrophosphate-binding protein [Chloroflexi bacterium]|nr:thiamine pyrophosphate-binding protein [Chloroflexota bacterium]